MITSATVKKISNERYVVEDGEKKLYFDSLNAAMEFTKRFNIAVVGPSRSVTASAV